MQTQVPSVVRSLDDCYRDFDSTMSDLAGKRENRIQQSKEYDAELLQLRDDEVSHAAEKCSKAVEEAHRDLEEEKKKQIAAADEIESDCAAHIARLEELRGKIGRGKDVAPAHIKEEDPQYDSIESMLNRVNNSDVWPMVKSILGGIATKLFSDDDNPIEVGGYYWRSRMIADLKGMLEGGISYMQSREEQSRENQRIGIADAERQYKDLCTSYEEARSAAENDAKEKCTRKMNREHELLANDLKKLDSLCADARQQYSDSINALNLQESYATPMDSLIAMLGIGEKPWGDFTVFSERIPKALPVGEMRMPIEAVEDCEAQVSDCLGLFYRDGVVGPAWISSENDKTLWVNYSSDEGARAIESGVRFAIASRMRLLPFGQFRVVFCDLRGCGMGIGRLNKLIDDNDQCVIETVATTVQQINDSLLRESQMLGKIGQKLPPYQCVAEYNEHCAGGEEIPFTFLVVNGIDQEEFTPSAANSLRAISEKSVKFGYEVVIVSGTGKIKDKRKSELLAEIAGQSTVLTESEKNPCEFDTSFGAKVSFHDDNYATDSFIWSFVDAYRLEAQKRNTIVIDSDLGRLYADDGTSLFVRKHITSAMNGDIQVPFAVNQRNEVISFGIGCFPNINTLVTGSVRSGKTVCLHSIIAGIAANYSPDELELWLVDFKGTEFKLYDPSFDSENVNEKPISFPHVSMIGLTTTEEFGDNLLELLDKEFGERRTKILQEARVSKIDDYNALEKKPTGCPNYLKHVVLIIDEFNVMCKYLRSTRTSDRFGTILKRYPALGLYCIFANQNLDEGGTPMLESDVLAQITGRVGFYNNAGNEFRYLFPRDFENTGLPDSYQISDHQCIYYQGNARYDYCKPVMIGEFAAKISESCGKEFGKRRIRVVDEHVRERLDRVRFGQAVRDGFGEKSLRCILGTPLSLISSYFAIEIGKRHSDHILVTGVKDDLRYSVSSAFAASFAEVEGNVLIVSPDESALQDRFKRLSECEGYDYYETEDGFCEAVSVAHGLIGHEGYPPTLLLLDGFDLFLDDVHEWLHESATKNRFGTDASRTGRAEGEIYGSSSIDDLCKRIAGLTAEEGSESSLAFNDFGRNENVFKNFIDILKRGPRYGVHVLWNSEKMPPIGSSALFGSARIDDYPREIFGHRFATKSQSLDSQLGFGFEARDIKKEQEDTLTMYCDQAGNISKFRPYLFE